MKLLNKFLLTKFTWNIGAYFTWISCETRFTCNSREIFHMNFTWNEFNVKLTWQFHVKFTWNKFHVKFTWKFHVKFTWNSFQNSFKKNFSDITWRIRVIYSSERMRIPLFLSHHIPVDQSGSSFVDQWAFESVFVRYNAVSYTHLTLPTICSV